MRQCNLWLALQQLPSCEAVLDEWKILLGPDFTNVRALLHPTVEHSLLYPCINHPSCDCKHEIIHHADRIVAACRCEPAECDNIELKPEDIKIHVLNLKKFTKALQDVFGFNASGNGITTLPAAPSAWPVGIYKDKNAPVYFLTQISEDEFIKELEGLIGTEHSPFILLTPSSRFKTPTIQTILQRQKAVMIPLAFSLSFKSPGNFTVTQSIQPILEQFKQGLPEVKTIVKTSQGKPLTPVPLPSGAKWEDITIKFLGEHKIQIKCKGKTVNSDYIKMGFEDTRGKKPNKQWKLLQLLALRNGVLAWEDSSKSKNTNIKSTEQDFGYEFDEDTSDAIQNKGFSIIKTPDKTKQLLSKSLKAVFQIDDDPFYDYKKEKGYKTKFLLISPYKTKINPKIAQSRKFKK